MKPQLVTKLADLVQVEFYKPNSLILKSNQNDIFKVEIGNQYAFQETTNFFRDHIPDDLANIAIWELNLFMNKVFKWQREHLLS